MGLAAILGGIFLGGKRGLERIGHANDRRQARKFYYKVQPKIEAQEKARVARIEADHKQMVDGHWNPRIARAERLAERADKRGRPNKARRLRESADALTKSRNAERAHTQSILGSGKVNAKDGTTQHGIRRAGTGTSRHAPSPHAKERKKR